MNIECCLIYATVSPPKICQFNLLWLVVLKHLAFFSDKGSVGQRKFKVENAFSYVQLNDLSGVKLYLQLIWECEQYNGLIVFTL